MRWGCGLFLMVLCCLGFVACTATPTNSSATTESDDVVTTSTQEKATTTATTSVVENFWNDDGWTPPVRP